MNFELLLCWLTLSSGIIWFTILFAKRCKCLQPSSWPKLLREPLDFVASLFPIFLLVFVFRSFIYEPFVIPTGSLEPTLDIGDFILVNKFDYGVRAPLSHKTLIPVTEPKRGDIMVFLYPEDPSVYFIKRVVGVPGDKISYVDKTLYINGEVQPQKSLGSAFEYDERGNVWPVEKREEILNGVRHDIFIRNDVADRNFIDVTVPASSYFVMGDNRDDSKDSRYWGFVPNENIVGRAAYIWFSWNSQTNDWLKKIRFKRMFSTIH